MTTRSIDVVTDPATGMIFAAMSEWDVLFYDPEPAIVAAAEKREGITRAQAREQGRAQGKVRPTPGVQPSIVK